MVEFATRLTAYPADFVEHRFVYRPHVTVPFVGSVERRSAGHVASPPIAPSGRSIQVGDDRYLAT